MSFPLVEIGQCCKVVNGSTPSRTKDEFWGGDIDWFTPKDLSGIESKYVTEAPEKITTEGYNSCSTTMVPTGSLLFTSRAPIGHLAISTKEVCTNQGFKTLIPNETLDVEYLYYAIKKYTPNLQDLGVGATFKELSKASISNFKIPIPPLPQQKKIAAILDAADGYRQKTKALIAKYDELTQSLFLDMFGDPVTNPKGWEHLPVGDYINIKHGFAFKSEFFVEYSDYTLLTPGNYYEEGGYKNQGKKQKYYEGDIPADYILKQGDVLVAMTEQAAGLLGSTLFVPKDGTYLHNQRLGLFEYIKDINPVFIYHVFNQPSFRKKVHMDATGTKVRHTSPSKLMNMEIGFPSLVLQNQFADRVQAIEAQKAKAQKSLAKAEDLFNSLLQKAFTGEL